MEKYRILGKKGEGTFSEVFMCQNLQDGAYCAVKRMRGKFGSWDQVNNLREVQALKRLNPHPNIIKLIEVIYDERQKSLDIVCELLEMNLYDRIKGRRHHLSESLVKSYIYQLCKALDHMHKNGIFHRDIKPENVLLQDEVLKLADFGSTRGVYSKPPFTEYISTRWYRAPECLLTDGYYSFKMDMWSVGCVFFEIMTMYPLFPGADEVDQLAKIHDILGTPTPAVLGKIRKMPSSVKFDFPAKQGSGLAKLLPHASSECLELLAGLLQYDPDERFSAKQALKHPYFKDLRDAEKKAAGGTTRSRLPQGASSEKLAPPSSNPAHLQLSALTLESNSSASLVEPKRSTTLLGNSHNPSHKELPQVPIHHVSIEMPEGGFQPDSAYDEDVPAHPYHPPPLKHAGSNSLLIAKQTSKENLLASLKPQKKNPKKDVAAGGKKTSILTLPPLFASKSKSQKQAGPPQLPSTKSFPSMPQKTQTMEPSRDYYPINQQLPAIGAHSKTKSKFFG